MAAWAAAEQPVYVWGYFMCVCVCVCVYYMCLCMCMHARVYQEINPPRWPVDLPEIVIVGASVRFQCQWSVPRLVSMLA